MLTPRTFDLLCTRMEAAERRADARAWSLAVVTARLMHGKSVAASQFFPFLGPRRAQSPDEQLALVEQLNALFGGEDLRTHP